MSIAMHKNRSVVFKFTTTFLAIAFPAIIYGFFTKLILWIDIVFHEVIALPASDIVLPFPCSWEKASIVTKIYALLLIPVCISMYFPIIKFIRRILQK